MLSRLSHSPSMPAMNSCKQSESYSYDDLYPFRSQYLLQGIKKEGWNCGSIYTTENSLSAEVNLINPFTSTLDEDNFHLSVFSVSLICADFLIFWACKKASLDSRSGEAWLKNLSFRAFKPIRSFHGIRFELDIEKYRVRSEKIFIKGRFRVSDANGGLFILDMSGVVMR